MRTFDKANLPKIHYFYFGHAPKPEDGHFMYECFEKEGKKPNEPIREVRRVYQSTVDTWIHFPFDIGLIDGGFLPKIDNHFGRTKEDEEGIVFTSRFYGWTVISWRDYSGDDRPGSNSNFLVNREDWSTRQMVEEFERVFPMFYLRLRKVNKLIPVEELDEFLRRGQPW